MSKDYVIEQLRALLEGLECRNVEGFIENASPKDLRRFGECITEAAKRGSMVLPAGTGEYEQIAEAVATVEEMIAY